MGFFVFLLFSSAVTVVVMIFDRQLIELLKTLQPLDELVYGINFSESNAFIHWDYMFLLLVNVFDEQTLCNNIIIYGCIDSRWL